MKLPRVQGNTRAAGSLGAVGRQADAERLTSPPWPRPGMARPQRSASLAATMRSYESERPGWQPAVEAYGSHSRSRSPTLRRIRATYRPPPTACLHAVPLQTLPLTATMADLLVCATCGTQFDVPYSSPLKNCRICDVSHLAASSRPGACGRGLTRCRTRGNTYLHAARNGPALRPKEASMRTSSSSIKAMSGFGSSPRSQRYACRCSRQKPSRL